MCLPDVKMISHYHALLLLLLLLLLYLLLPLPPHHLPLTHRELVVMASSLEDMTRYIDKDQIPPEYGGGRREGGEGVVLPPMYESPDEIRLWEVVHATTTTTTTITMRE